MNPKLRTALLATAAVCIAVAVYYPITRFFENKAIDDEMDALRQMRRQVAETSIPPEMDMAGIEQADALDSTRGETDWNPGKTDRMAALTGDSNGTKQETSRAPELPETSVETGVAAERMDERRADQTAEGAYTEKSVDSPFPSPSPALGNTSVQVEAPEAGTFPASQEPEPTPFVFHEANILPEFKPLYEENPDLVGWLKIPGTAIDYPVLQREDEEYYLTRDFYGRDNANGQLILDAQCDPFTPSANLVISGHNMKSGKMFGALMNYASRDFGKKHSIIEFDTLFEKGQYRLVAAFYAWDYEKHEDGFRYNTDVRYRIEMVKYLEELGRVKRYDTGVDVEFGDEIITLSTCSYQTDDGRFVVVARRIRDGEEL